MTLYTRIRSWHVLENGKTLCGRKVDVFAPVDTDLPAEKSCETCLRILARKRELPYPDNDAVEL